MELESPMNETCTNCQELIGKLETAYIWRENVVCSACYKRLSAMNQVRTIGPPSQMDKQPNGLRTGGGIVLLISVILGIAGGSAAIPLSSLLFVVGVVLWIAGAVKG